MAVIENFVETREGKGRHRTTVECGWQKIHDGGDVLLQLSTYGSDARQSEKKVSQTIQLDRRAADELVAIIRSVFP